MPTCPTCRLTAEEGAKTCPVDGTPLATETSVLGKVLGDRYRILSVLGKGGMGTVYLAEHVVLGKQFAVKILRDELSRDEDLVRRFQQEAVAASRIGQENIVSVTDFGRSPEGALYFVMEHIEGPSLAALLALRGAIPAGRAVPILSQICRALAAAHAKGIVHRDLKPDNVIIAQREDGTDLAKVLDFGISKVAAQPNGGRLTQVGVLMGTPEYMAPEQVEAASVDLRVDVYSFGALAYEVVTGSIPFTAATPVGILVKHQTQAPEPPRQRRPDLPIPAALEATILRALEKKPEARQQSMTEVLTELASCASSLGLPAAFTPLPNLATAVQASAATPAGVSDEIGYAATFTPRPSSAPLVRPATHAPTFRPAAAPSVGEADSDAALAARAVRRGPARWLAVGAGVVLLAGAAAVYLMSSNGTAPASAATPAPLPEAALPVPAVPLPPVAPPDLSPPEPAAAATRLVRLRSSPAGATVWVNGAKVGATPLELNAADGAFEVRFTRAGFRREVRTVFPSDTEVEVTLKARSKRDPRVSEEDPYGKIDDFKDDPF